MVTRCQTSRARFAAGLLMTILLPASPARAFAPEVPRELARAALAEDAARLLGDASASEVERRLAGEEADPEAFAAAHAWFAPAPGDASTTAYGAAPAALAAAYDALVQGFADGDPAAITAATAALAIAASDLADPFRTAGPGRAGPAGARARFADSPETGPFDAAPGSPVVPLASADAARAAAASLAARSAALRDSVEALAGTGREAELALLRRARIEDALGLARDAVAGARAAAGQRALEAAGSGSRTGISVLPNPARAHALLAFRADAAGTATVRVTSVDGRRVAEFSEPVQAGAVALGLAARLPRGLASGSYLVSVTAPGVDGVARFVRLAH
jgi:hypothetical protein